MHVNRISLLNKGDQPVFCVITDIVYLKYTVKKIMEQSDLRYKLVTGFSVKSRFFFWPV